MASGSLELESLALAALSTGSSPCVDPQSLTESSLPSVSEDSEPSDSKSAVLTLMCTGAGAGKDGAGDNWRPTYEAI